MSFLNKYIPKTLDDLYGNKIQINKAIEWISNFKDKKDEERILLLSGPPGTGKTSLAHILLKKFNYHPIEFNASEVRSQKVIEQKLSKIINQQSIFIMFDQSTKPAIIMDEVDGCLSGDRGGISQLLKMTSPKKSKKNKKNFKLHTPIICICNDDSSKSINELKKKSLYLKFKLPSKYHIIEFIKKICRLEDLKLKESFYKYLYNHSQNDFRRILTILETLKTKYIKKPKIKKKYIKEVLAILDKKNVNFSLKDTIPQILYNDEITFDNICEYTESDIFMIPLILHDNFPEYLEKNTEETTKKKSKVLLKYYKSMMDYCNLETIIFKNQNWFFSQYSTIFSCMNCKLLFKKLKKTIYQKKNYVNHSSMLIKISLTYLNKKNLRVLCEKLSISINMFQSFSEIILHALLDNKDDDEVYIEIYNNMIAYLQTKKIDKKDFNKIIKLNYYSKYWNKKFNKKLKKQIFNDLET